MKTKKNSKTKARDLKESKVIRQESRPSVRQRRLPPSEPVLRFTPPAWAKLLYFCHKGQTEIGGFGVTAAEDPLLIEDFVTVKQTVTIASVAFDDTAVADFFEDQVEAGRVPGQFGRIWLHTHPGDDPSPSSVDEHTFVDAFGKCDWAVMFILARTGNVYARLRFNVGPGGEVVLPVHVEYGQPFGGSAHEEWEAEYQSNVQVHNLMTAFDRTDSFADMDLGETDIWDEEVDWIDGEDEALQWLAANDCMEDLSLYPDEE